jgi:hypothetical protein
MREPPEPVTEPQRPLLLVQTSDVVGADRGARVHEVAEVNVVDDGGVVDCPNACS